MRLYDKIHKFNPNHDPKNGRFTSGRGGSSGGSAPSGGEEELRDDGDPPKKGVGPYNVRAPRKGVHGIEYDNPKGGKKKRGMTTAEANAHFDRLSRKKNPKRERKNFTPQDLTQLSDKELARRKGRSADAERFARQASREDDERMRNAPKQKNNFAQIVDAIREGRLK